jgi:hypothetical protein
MTRDIQNFIKQYSNYEQRNGTMPTQQNSDSTKIDWRTPIVEYLNQSKTENRGLFEKKNETYFMKKKNFKRK